MKTSYAGSNALARPVAGRYVWAIRLLLFCGILSALVWLGTDLIASFSYPGYRYPIDVISGLTAVGSPVRSFVSPMVTVYSLLKIAFAVGIWLFAARNLTLRITAIALFAFGVTDLIGSFFPYYSDQPLLSLSNILHSIFAGVLAVVFFLLAIGLGAQAGGRRFRIYSYATILIMLVSGGVMGLMNPPNIQGNQPPAWFGLTERINGYSFMFWMLVFSILLLRLEKRERHLL